MDNNQQLIIAIDGPASSGKSTLGRNLAEKLGYLYFDTGVMYRAVACVAEKSNIDLSDESALSSLAAAVKIDVQPASVDDGRENDVLVDGVDLTWEIRTPKVDRSVSIVAASPGVRKALTSQQRRIGLRGGVVMVGRDIGTIVLPEANLKVFLDASLEERASRRYQERIQRGEAITYDEIHANLFSRDEIDSNRDVAPLRAAEDAYILDSNDIEPEKVLEIALSWVELAKRNPENQR